VGDVTYGADPTLSAKLRLSRQWLHARALSFLHPRTQEEVRFVSAYPDDLQHALVVLQDAG
jgi:23S rRNA pseudouridine1911/1915/1917 synthase